MENLNKDRKALFKDPPPFLARFIELLNLCPMEAWPEFETLIKGLQDEDLRHYMDTELNTGIEAAMDNPFLMHAENHAEEQGAVLLSLKTVGPSSPNAIFGKTRAFYAALGFIQVEELPLWGPDGACLLMVKDLTP